MNRKVVAIWVSLVILFGFVVIVIEIAPKVTAYTPHDPFRINSNAEFASMAGIEGWVGDGSPGNPYVIEGYDINGSGYGYCIYIGNTTVHFVVRDCYLHEASGVGLYPLFSDSGLILYKVENGIISNNIMSSNSYLGISLYSSSANTITNNTASSNTGSGIHIGGIHFGYLSHSNIIANNTASNNYFGIHLFNTDGNAITNNSCSNNFNGIYLRNSDGNAITNNSCSNNNKGIYLRNSDGNAITNNSCSNNNIGIYLDLSSSNIIANNNASNNYEGIHLDRSESNTITKNTVSNNKYGIYLYSSSCNTITNNTMVEDGIFLAPGALTHWNTQIIDTSNTVNGKTVYYLKNSTGGIVPSGAGQVILANCTNVVVQNQNVSNGSVGIQLGFSLYNTITNNNASNNVYGIYLYSSSSNTIANNTISSSNVYGIYLSSSSSNNIVNNTISSNNNCGIYLYFSSNNNITDNIASNNWDYGIYLSSSSSNTIINNSVSSNNGYGIYIEYSDSSDNGIYHNKIISNTNQAYDDTNNGNQWDNGYPSGGNYWSDYNGVDNFQGPNQDLPGSDGIGDTNYSIDPNSIDHYPLIEPAPCNFFYLYPGWNLISIPRQQDNTSLTSVLQSIQGEYDAAQWYNSSDLKDPWKHYQVTRPGNLNDLDKLNHLIGIWIHVTNPNGIYFRYYGIQLARGQSITMHPGWNMVGYPSLTSYNRTAGLNNLTFGDQVDAIWSYDAATQKWEEMGESDYFQIGRGYYIHAKSKCEWVVPL